MPCERVFLARSVSVIRSSKSAAATNPARARREYSLTLASLSIAGILKVASWAMVVELQQGVRLRKKREEREGEAADLCIEWRQSSSRRLDGHVIVANKGRTAVSAHPSGLRRSHMLDRQTGDGV